MLRDHVTGGGSACRGAASGGSSSVFGLTRPFSNGGGPQWAKLPKNCQKLDSEKLVKLTAHPYMPATIWQIFIWRYNHRKWKRCQICLKLVWKRSWNHNLWIIFWRILANLSSLYACNKLTDFYMKIQSPEMETMSNFPETCLEKVVKNHNSESFFGAF